MRIKRLKLKNIRSYLEEEFDFPEGSLLLSGDVGSGKTTILLALEYALFGLQPGQKGSSLLRHDADFGEVFLEFEVNGKDVIVERRIKRSNRSVNNDYAAISVNGKKVESSITEVKTKILSILGYPQEFIKKNNILYRYTVYTPQEQMKQIILEDPEIRLNVLRHVFGIDRYKRVRENLLLIVSSLKEQVKILSLEVKSLTSEKEQLTASRNLGLDLDLRRKEREEFLLNLKGIRKSVEKDISEVDSKIEERQILEKEIEKSAILISTKKETISSLIKEINEISSLLQLDPEKFDEEKYLAVERQILEKKKLLEKMNSSLIELMSKLDSLQRSRNSFLTKRERVFQISMCPTCLQDVPDFHKHNIMNETDQNLSELKKDEETSILKKEELSNNINSENEILNNLQKDKERLAILKSRLEYLEKSRLKLEELKKKKELLEKDILLLSSHMASLKEQSLALSIYDNIYKSKEEELKNCFIQERNVEITIAELKKEMELNEKSILSLDEKIKSKETLNTKLAQINELSSWLSTQFLTLVEYIERNVLIKLRKEFSTLFAKWFGVLAGDSFEVHLDESFSPLIMQGEAEMDYSFLSGGERTAVALAYRLALNQTINSLLSNIKTKDIIILDEPTEGFSETQIEKMRDIFDELDVKQLIIVSHEQKIEGFIDNIIKVKKEFSVSSTQKVYSETPPIVETM